MCVFAWAMLTEQSIKVKAVQNTVISIVQMIQSFTYLGVKSDIKVLMKRTLFPTIYILQSSVSFAVTVVSEMQMLKYQLSCQKVENSSLSESEASFEGCHTGESHFSQEPAARRETGAHRFVKLEMVQQT